MPRVVVDTRRLARVATWPSGWTPGMSAAQVAHVLGPQRPSVMLKGSRGHDRGRQPGAGRLPPARPVAGRSSTTRAPRGRSASAPTAGAAPPRRPGCPPASRAACSRRSASVARRRSSRPCTAPRPSSRSPSTASRCRALSTPPGGRRPPRSARREGSACRRSSRAGTSPCRSTRARSNFYAGISPTDVPAVVPVLWGRTADPVDPAADRLVGAVHGPLGRHRRVGALPRAVGHADRLHDVRPQHQPEQQHERGLHLGPRGHPAGRCSTSSRPAACRIPRPRRPRARCSTRTRSPSPCGSTSWSPCW